MSKEKSSLANLLRNHINEQLQNKFDYTLASNRKQDILNFIEKNKTTLDKNQLNLKTMRPSHTRFLDEILKNRGIDPKTLGRKTKTVKLTSDLKSTITPAPQAGAVDSIKPAPTVGAPVDGSIPAPLMIFDQKGVSATLNGVFLMFKMAYPEMELLSEDEKDALGNMWLPAFNKYLQENWAIIGIPFIGTMGIFLPKIVEARKKKKIRNSKGEAQAKQDEIDSKNLEKEKQKTPAPRIGVFSTEIKTEEKKND